ncbi:MAG TPA: polyhydroxyalkanoate depolymerase, partial [Hyphomicrobium sp.]|nr:polyhydroxyalkanoate depolymerase [Hyphomicrobium sp.]
MHYYAYELAHAIVRPLRFGAEALKYSVENPFNPFSATPMNRSIAAACEVFENVTRRYGKPHFGLKETRINGVGVPVSEEIVAVKPFCNLIHFKRHFPEGAPEINDPKVLIVAPMSGHYATLLRGTVAAMLPEHEVYITDWADAREVPIFEGRFDLNSFIDYLIEFIHTLGSQTHVIAVCQPAVPALAATAVMADNDDPMQPASLTL